MNCAQRHSFEKLTPGVGKWNGNRKTIQKLSKFVQFCLARMFYTKENYSFMYKTL
jgi:hypothetical protein